MKNALIGLLLATAIATPALASGNHAGGHGEAMAVGEPGDQSKVTQTIRVTMKETPDGKMVFTPNNFKVRKGQTVRFTIKNEGELDHEFVLDQEDKIMEHKALMEKFPDMQHDDPNAIRSHPASRVRSSGGSPMTAYSNSPALFPDITTRECTATWLSPSNLKRNPINEKHHQDWSRYRHRLSSAASTFAQEFTTARSKKSTRKRRRSRSCTGI